MQGSILSFYVHEGDRHGGQMVWEWLVSEANKRGVGGGSVFRAMAGFGREHVLHERKFFELAGSQILKIEFIVTDEEARDLLALVHQEQLRLFYAHIPVQFGVIDPTTPQPPTLE
jgi:PII-like signaling protein